MTGAELSETLEAGADAEALTQNHEQQTSALSLLGHMPAHPLAMHGLLNVELQNYLPDLTSLRQQAVKVAGCLCVTTIVVVSGVIAYKSHYQS